MIKNTAKGGVLGVNSGVFGNVAGLRNKFVLKQKYAVIPYMIRNLFMNITSVSKQTLNRVQDDFSFFVL